MSSDEEDEGAPFVRYRVVKKTWRHVRVTKLLRLLDALHRRWRKKGRAKRGSRPRVRFLDEDLHSTRTAVSRLPKNAYDEHWLSTLKTHRREELAVDKDHDFTIDISVNEYVPILFCVVLCLTNIITTSSAAKKYMPVALDGFTYV